MYSMAEAAGDKLLVYVEVVLEFQGNVGCCG